MSPVIKTITGEDLRAAFLSAVEDEWAQCVKSVGDEARISQYFSGIGWQWYLDDNTADGVYSEKVRKSTGMLNFCGAGPAFLLVHAVGDHLRDGMCVPVRLKLEIADYVLPSTRRANDPEKWARAGVERPKRVRPADLQPGDLITVRTRGVNPYHGGDHFAVVSGPIEGDRVPTIEFNATGTLGDGSRGRGVVRRSRRLGTVRQIIRFEREHFEEGL